jgi:hypothetical protein
VEEPPERADLGPARTDGPASRGGGSAALVDGALRRGARDHVLGA